ncbi:MAG: hypothetical protein QM599_11190 [Pseudoxanthomonas sp.]
MNSNSSANGAKDAKGKREPSSRLATTGFTCNFFASFAFFAGGMLCASCLAMTLWIAAAGGCGEEATAAQGVQPFQPSRHPLAASACVVVSSVRTAGIAESGQANHRLSMSGQALRSSTTRNNPGVLPA